MKHIFVPLTKVDAEKRLVYGVAAIEQLDKSGEIFDYEGSKPLFQKWSNEVGVLSMAAVEAFGENSKSYGNVREMHTTKAAGKLASPIGFDDLNKTIEVCAKVADDAAWAKVQDGIYTGFSIGGEYEKRWDDEVIKFRNKAAKRYTAAPGEISLVDMPCMPGATFNFIKAAGATELRKFATVEFEAEDIPAALYKICEALGSDGAAKSTPHERALRVIKRAKELNVDATGFAKAYIDQFGGELGQKALKKGLYDIMDVASALMNLNYCRLCLEDQAEWQGNETAIPGRLKELIVTLSSILVDLTAEETAKLVPDLVTAKAAMNELDKEISTVKKFFATHGAAIEKAAASSMDPELQKMATHLKEIGKHVDGIQKAHSTMGEHLDELNPKEEPAAPGGAQEPASTEKALGSAMAKVYDVRLQKMEDGQKETATQIGNLVDAFNKFIGSQPAAPRVAINPQTITKAADGAEPPPAVIDPKDPDAALKVMKSIHANGAQALSLVK